MANVLPWPLKLVFASVFVLLYYCFFKKIMFAGARRMAHRIYIHGRYDHSEISGVLELVTAAFSHVLVVVVLLVLTGVPFSHIHLEWAALPLLLLGVLTGIGEMALSSFACRLVIEASLRFGGGAARRAAGSRGGRGAPQQVGRARAATPAAIRQTGPVTVKAWLAVGRGGWLRHHFKTLEVLPLPVAVAVMAIQVGSEEVVFRGIFLDFFRPAGFAIAFTASFILFVTMQVFFMSSWRAAMFPVIGAVVMGVVQGVLAWYVPNLLPLVVAHIVFFIFAVI
ncbi:MULTISPECIES: type II CAAX prenyl endopeptidase Rce1 family protein [unclassified Amycolatopsis]|uniref:CPBP family glutamic-type intramembrane protease n=1 Tax=unclassified Amycolatopsis TaxID=2618356 RepID=UPI00106ED84C|nr:MULTISPECIES: CPBP family glutamic-type intramembrane protease [unclassified Amycolatopsis]